jgi:hypothetical protein
MPPGRRGGAQADEKIATSRGGALSSSVVGAQVKRQDRQARDILADIAATISAFTPSQRLSVHTTSAFARVPEGGAPDSSLSFNPFRLHLTSPRPHTHPSFTSPRLHLTSPSPNPPSHPPTVTQPAFTHTPSSLNTAFAPPRLHLTSPSPNPFFTQHRIRTTPPSRFTDHPTSPSPNPFAFTQPLLYPTLPSHRPAFTPNAGCIR